MIAKWKVSNFKSIRQETELDFGPLTIFAGANSCGKSTLIQSVLLIAQTLAHKVGSRSIVLNGALTSLGQLDDLKSHGAESDQITIGFTCQPKARRSRQLREITCEVSFGADHLDLQGALSQIYPRLFAARLSCAGDKDGVDGKADFSTRYDPKKHLEVLKHNQEQYDLIRQQHSYLDIWIDKELLDQQAYDVKLDDDSWKEMTNDNKTPGYCKLRHFLPDTIRSRIGDGYESDANRITERIRDTAYGLESPMVLHEEVIAVVRKILGETIDFDQTFKDTDWSKSC